MGKKKAFITNNEHNRTEIKKNDKIKEGQRENEMLNILIKRRRKLKRKEGGGFLTPDVSWWFGFGARLG